MIKETLNQIPNQLASFSNSELYFIFSELLGLGGLGSGLIEEESLYIKPSADCCGEYLTFLFISKLPIISECQDSSTIHVTIGKLDSSFNEIHLHSISYPETEDNSLEIDLDIVNNLLKTQDTSTFYQPAELIDGILNIIDQPGFLDREFNPLFELKEKFENSHAKFFELIKIKNIDYRGMYFKVANPNTESSMPSTKIYNFSIPKTDGSTGFYEQELYVGEHIVNTETFSVLR